MLCKIRVFFDGWILFAWPGTDVELGGIDHAHPFRNFAKLHCSLCGFLVFCCTVIDPYVAINRRICEFIFLIAARSAVCHNTWCAGCIAFIGVDVGCVIRVYGSNV